MTTLLIDGDILLYKVVAGNQQSVDWGDGVSTLHTSHQDCIQMMKAIMRVWIERFDPVDIRIALTGSDNFRKGLADDYKGHRVAPKPVGFGPLKTWLAEHEKARVIEGIEADDLLAIWATSGKFDDPIIISDDKDFRQVPGKLFVPRTEELLVISKEDADRWHLHQTLVGDKADNYPGCPGIGEVRASKLLDEDCSWKNVLAAFEAAGKDEDFALLQARLARLLRFGEYSIQKGPKLWTPKKSSNRGRKTTGASKTKPSSRKTSKPASEKAQPSAS